MKSLSILARPVPLILLLFIPPAVAVAQSEQAKTQIVPLDQIWAWRMPGTREIKESATPADLKRLESLMISRYERADRLKFKDLATPGLAVSGGGLSAMSSALAALAEEKTQGADFSTEDEVTLVFFSEPVGGNRVEVQKVERQKNQIEIRYQLVPGLISGGSKVNFALVPLGKLPIGRYEVKIRQSPREERLIKWGYKPLDEKWSGNFLCKPFSFNVR